MGRVTGCQVKDSSDLSAEKPFEKDVSPFPLLRPMPGGNSSDGISNKRSIAFCALLSSSLANTFFRWIYPVRSNKYFCFSVMVFLIPFLIKCESFHQNHVFPVQSIMISIFTSDKGKFGNLGAPQSKPIFS